MYIPLGSYIKIRVSRGCNGHGALLYKKYFDKDGKLINTVKDSRSEYHFHPEDIKYPEPTPTPPPATPEPTPPPAPEPEPPTP